MVFGLFSKDRALKRAMDKTVNKLAQSPDRLAAMDKLRQDGSEEALFGLCRRLSFDYDKMIEDHDEKQWVIEVLVSRGEAALAPLRRYMKIADSVAHALRATEQIVDPQGAIDIAAELLADEEPGYTRDPKKRLQVIEWLGELDDVPPAEVARLVSPYLADFDENVRFQSATALAQKTCPEAAAPLVQALINPEDESRRLKIKIAELLADTGLSLAGHEADVGHAIEDIPGVELKKHKLIRVN
ncbi:MAG TPA: HEAT repeat domain-containing protein [Kofleriaceae bacterium]|nr:HEAT repeat domain-containing protein [Kofleriaceae bacterium]